MDTIPSERTAHFHLASHPQVLFAYRPRVDDANWWNMLGVEFTCTAVSLPPDLLRLTQNGSSMVCDRAIAAATRIYRLRRRKSRQSAVLAANHAIAKAGQSLKATAAA